MIFKILWFNFMHFKYKLLICKLWQSNLHPIVGGMKKEIIFVYLDFVLAFQVDKITTRVTLQLSFSN